MKLSSKINDDTFLNDVQGRVTQWINQIRKVTILPSTTTFPSIASSTNEDGIMAGDNADLEEVSFWTTLEVALKHIRSELTKPEVVLTLSLLKAAKRFVATIALENNTGLENAESHTNDVANYLRHYPIQSLVAARDWNKISTAMDSIFAHLPKVRQSRFYDLERCVKLLEATTFTLRQRMEVTLKDKYKSNGIMLSLDFEDYEKNVYGPMTDIFIRFDEHYEQFSEFILEQGRRRRVSSLSIMGDTKTPTQIIQSMVLYHHVLRERMDAIHQFRSQHEKLRTVVLEVLAGEQQYPDTASAVLTTVGSTLTTTTSLDEGDNSNLFSSRGAIREVEEAPISIFAAINVLDLTPKGKVAFTAALEAYDRKIDAIEERLAKLLRDKLTACKDAESMFGVFARFNPLLTRPRVRAAVKEFQVELIATVGQAIEHLQSKFTHKFEQSAASRISNVRGIPPISGKILWAKMIERQVHALMERMSNVLGTNWGQHLEGRLLRRSGDDLLSKLDAKAFFRSWVTEWERELSSDATAVNARLNSYPIIITQDISSGIGLFAKVNFDEKYELLFREIRYLKWLGYGRDIPRTVSDYELIFYDYNVYKLLTFTYVLLHS